MTQVITWRNVCEATIKAHTEVDAMRFWSATSSNIDTVQPAFNYFNYRFEHTLAVVKIIRWLARETGADSEITECAAWLHDCRKFLSDEKSHANHAQEAALAVTSILDGTDFPKVKLPAVQHAISHHAGFELSEKLNQLETACLWDADKLSKLGAAGLIHYVSFVTSLEKLDTEIILKRGEYWLTRAKVIAKSMNTAPARKEANLRLAFITNYYQQLEREWKNPIEPLK